MHDSKEFLDTQPCLVFFIPKFIPKYTMLDGVKGNYSTRKAVHLMGTLEAVAEPE